MTADASLASVLGAGRSAPPARAADSPAPLRTGARAVVILATSAAYLVPALPAAGAIRATRGRDDAARFLSRRCAALLQRLGPTFVKCGQMVGTRRDLIPPALCEALDALADAVEPMSPEQARAALSAAYGTDLGPFASVDLDPVASGSVACVYRGTLAGGREVAIKLQRPGIRRVMAADLALVRAVGALAARLRAFRGTPVREIAGYVCDAVYAQLDFAREAENLARLRADLAPVPRVLVPAVERGASRDTALVMEFVPGLDASAAAGMGDAVRRRCAARTLAAVYRMVFMDGFVHCDLHRGNLYFAGKGQVVVLDAGFTVQLSERIRRLFAEFFLHLSLGDGERCARIVVESSSGLRPGADLEGFTRGMADLVERSSRAPARDFSVIAFATEMFALQREHGLHAASEIVFPLLSLLVIEGTIRDLDPDVDFQQEAQPLLVKAVFDAPPGGWSPGSTQLSPQPATTQEQPCR
ncbi:MAG TPA: AarF/UbiB family protein [Solirubrobacteraceae bacterium]|nr:AarF/UbiB family protein [Solirubrobacteraceae bacterium]